MKRILMAVLVVVGSIAAVIGCQKSAPAGPQTVKVAVTDAGFVPAEVDVRSGQPVVLLVTRTTDETCAKEIVIADEHIRRELPLNREVAIAFTPEKKGEIRYACGMDMVAGTMKVE
jgi:plastocyanin domain-containing protein